MMFENIIGQTEMTRTLRAELGEGRFPRASLFFGPSYCGKLSTALEVARALTCVEGRADWSCDCPSCRLQKELAHPHTVLLGPRYADVEIAACADALLRSRKPAAQYLFLRAIRKLTRRFDSSVVDSDDARVKSAQEKVARLEELAAELPLGAELSAEVDLGGLLERLIAAAAPVAAQVRGDGIGIGQVRGLAAWAHMTAAGSRKVAIIENADRMQDSARNALLKLLEEPPASVHIILLTTRRAAIIPTILSRLRPYSFSPRTTEEQKEVMVKIFRRETPGFESLRSFFLAWREINPEKIAQVARRFMELVLLPGTGDVDIVEEMAEVFPDRKGQRDRSTREVASSLLEELMGQLLGLLTEDRVGAETLERWSAAVREAQLRLESFNMQPPAVIEAMFYRMRDAARAEEQPGALQPRGTERAG